MSDSGRLCLILRFVLASLLGIGWAFFAVSLLTFFDRAFHELIICPGSSGTECARTRPGIFLDRLF